MEEILMNMEKIIDDYNLAQGDDGSLIERIAKVIHPLAFVPDQHQSCMDLASLYRAKARERARTVLDIVRNDY